MQNIKEFNRGVVTVDPKNKTATTVILLHGLGADASDLSSMSMYLQSSQENIRFVLEKQNECFLEKIEDTSTSKTNHWHPPLSHAIKSLLLQFYFLDLLLQHHG